MFIVWYFLLFFFLYMFVGSVMNPLFSLFILVVLSLSGFLTCYLYGSSFLLSFMFLLCMLGGVVIVFSFVVMEMMTFFSFNYYFPFLLGSFLSFSILFSLNFCFSFSWFIFSFPIMIGVFCIFFMDMFLVSMNISSFTNNSKMSKV